MPSRLETALAAQKKGPDAVDFLFPLEYMPQQSHVASPVRKKFGRAELGQTADAIMRQNAEVPFVQRMINPGNFPGRSNPGGSMSTHLLSSASDDKQHYVYPTLRLQDGLLRQNEDPGSAIKAGNAVAFQDFDEAEKFARGSWKQFAGKLPAESVGLPGAGDDPVLRRLVAEIAAGMAQ
tara:strand:+ start:220 stop:756 length:537 start_codon:yes stop_codon:yes gene_type:complete